MIKEIDVGWLEVIYFVGTFISFEVIADNEYFAVILSQVIWSG